MPGALKILLVAEYESFQKTTFGTCPSISRPFYNPLFCVAFVFCLCSFLNLCKLDTYHLCVNLEMTGTLWIYLTEPYKGFTVLFFSKALVPISGMKII